MFQPPPALARPRAPGGILLHGPWLRRNGQINWCESILLEKIHVILLHTYLEIKLTHFGRVAPPQSPLDLRNISGRCHYWNLEGLAYLTVKHEGNTVSHHSGNLSLSSKRRVMLWKRLFIPKISFPKPSLKNMQRYVCIFDSRFPICAVSILVYSYSEYK